MALLILSADPVALTPAVLRALSRLPCGACGAPGRHRIFGVRSDGANALCSRCGDPQLGQDARQNAVDALHGRRVGPAAPRAY